MKKPVVSGLNIPAHEYELTLQDSINLQQKYIAKLEADITRLGIDRDTWRRTAEMLGQGRDEWREMWKEKCVGAPPSDGVHHWVPGGQFNVESDGAKWICAKCGVTSEVNPIPPAASPQAPAKPDRPL